MKNSLFPLLSIALFTTTATRTFATPALSSPIRQAVISADTVGLKQYVGTYKFGEGLPLERFVIKLENGSLYGEADTNGSNKLLPQTEKDTFKSTSSYGSIIVFQRDSKTNAVTGLILKIMGQEAPAKKEQ